VALASNPRVEGLRVAEHEIGEQRGRGEQRDDRDRGDPRGARRRGDGRRGRHRELVTEPRDDLLVRTLALVRVDDAGRDIVVELARLVAVDRRCRVGLDGRVRGTTTSTASVATTRTNESQNRMPRTRRDGGRRASVRARDGRSRL
jgi:hypothetical protein